MKRRRFLKISVGAMLAGPAIGQVQIAGQAGASEWRGEAFGAETRILVRNGAASETVIAAVRAELERIESVFSLYRDSELTRLNRDGIGAGSALFRQGLDLALKVHQATEGAFDPGVQSQWAALVQGRKPEALSHSLTDIHIGKILRLMPAQSLTFNGLAQGLASDRIAALPEVQGLGEVLVDMGEPLARNGAFRLELSDPEAGRLGQITLGAGRAVATSSPGAMRFAGGQSHILGPQGQPALWSTVSVEAGSAALADAAATAFVLMPRPAIKKAAARLGVGPVRLVDQAGNLSLL